MKEVTLGKGIWWTIVRSGKFTLCRRGILSLGEYILWEGVLRDVVGGVSMFELYIVLNVRLMVIGSYRSV